MKYTEMNSKLRICLLVVLYLYHCKCDCDNSRDMNYVHFKYVHTKTLQTDAGITNGAPVVKSYLAACLFQRFVSPAAMCGYHCHKNENCIAHEVSKGQPCELCLRNVDTGRNASEIAKSDMVYIHVDKLEDYIDGMFIILIVLLFKMISK